MILDINFIYLTHTSLSLPCLSKSRAVLVYSPNKDSSSLEDKNSMFSIASTISFFNRDDIF
ncbi:hypothetical protein OFP75_03535 [Brachyspira hyodysenteriae]|nr:hypothetical protein [Brachyspira hyodysenteriae]MCZ9847551.1 hypothetical protein [Brachyspira hyodysenteriae]